jgi:acyl dehydratase
MKVYQGLDEFREAVGTSLGVGEWFEITQDMVDKFADATGDHQWIHVDPERAAGGPFGGTIAHGYLTLSLVPVLADAIYRIDGLAMGINYGAEKLRFPTPVPTGSRIRESAFLESLQDGPAGSQARITFTVEVEGQEKPACVVTVIFLLAEAPAAQPA